MTSQPDRLITLQCPSCGARAAFYAGDPGFKCQYCGNEHLFNLPTGPAPVEGGRRDAGAGRRDDADSAGQKSLPRPQLSRPSAVTLQQQAGRLTLKRRWLTWKVVPMAFFCVFWDGFLCFWYSIALASPNGPAVMMLLFPLLHVAAGVVLTYTLFANLFNHTTIQVDRERFAVQHDPVPWPGEIKIPVQDLKQLYCKKKVSHGRNSTSVTYTLSAVLRDGTEKKLLTGLESPDVAGFIEQSIEKWLNIPDQRVTGEMDL